MYVVVVTATTLVLPIGFALVACYGYNGGVDLPFFLGKWYVFWAGGVRLFLAGLRQVFNPGYTLGEIFGIDHPPSKHIVQELGFANLAMGTLGMCALLGPTVITPGALVAGLYYGLAGVRHAFTPGHSSKRLLAMITDLIVFVMLAVFFVTHAGLMVEV